MQIKINTPKVRSDEALARIQQMLHWMERIGRLQHGAMVPPGADVSKMNEGDELWQPWTSEERNYFKGVRTIFAHARCSVLGNGAPRVRDRSRYRPGKPDIDGSHFDKETTDWEWDAQEFQEFAQRLKALVLQRFQFYHIATALLNEWEVVLSWRHEAKTASLQSSSQERRHHQEIPVSDT